MAALVAAGGALPLVLSDYWLDVAIFWGIYALLGLSLNLIVGEVGLFNMGHTAFFAIGAYGTVLLNQAWGLSLWLLMPLSGLLAAAAGYGLSRPIIHLRGDYLLVATIGLNEILRVTLVNNPWGLTGGPNGLILLDQFTVLGRRLDDPAAFYYLVWGVVGLVVWALLRLQHSRIGRAWNCVREDEVAAEAMGIDVRQAKLLAFVLGAGLAGAAGTLYAAKMVVVSPESFTFMEAVILFAIVVLGGLGSIPGVLVGSAAMMVLPEVLRDFAQYRMLFFGAAMALMMVFRPQGLWPSRRWSRQLTGEREP
ncbi:MAG: branched-chain amino acid ABC transporter permease [Firmicutes bacterium]|nr:branched-chain amino acid ABC transporter permease [Bacillota bacterium]